jgi:cytochrome oxidase assembly protein ShyY1
MRLGIWNVQRLKNKSEIIIKDLEKLKLDIIFTEKKRRAMEWK